MKQKDVLLILIPTFIITILWVVFSIYHNFTASTIVDPLTIQILPLSGSFDEKSIQSIKKRQRIDPLYELQTVPGLSPTISPSPAPVASISAIPEEIIPASTETIIP